MEKITYKLFHMCLHRYDSVSQTLLHSGIFQANALQTLNKVSLCCKILVTVYFNDQIWKVKRCENSWCEALTMQCSGMCHGSNVLMDKRPRSSADWVVSDAVDCLAKCSASFCWFTDSITDIFRTLSLNWQMQPTVYEHYKIIRNKTLKQITYYCCCHLNYCYSSFFCFYLCDPYMMSICLHINLIKWNKLSSTQASINAADVDTIFCR